MDRRNVRQQIVALLLCALVGVLCGCAQAPAGDLFYIAPGPRCPQYGAKSLNLYNPAGFTSRFLAIKVAATETTGTHVYWKQRARLLRSELANDSQAPAPRATLTAELDNARRQGRLFAHCTRVVIRGKPPATPVPTPGY